MALTEYGKLRSKDIVYIVNQMQECLFTDIEINDLSNKWINNGIAHEELMKILQERKDAVRECYKIKVIINEQYLTKLVDKSKV